MKERTPMVKIDLTRFKNASTAEDLGEACGFASQKLFDAALMSAAATLLLTDSEDRTLDLLSEDEHVAFAMLVIPNVAHEHPSPLFDTNAEYIEYYFTKPSKTISMLMLHVCQDDKLLNRIISDQIEEKH